MIVVDASVALELFLVTPDAARIRGQIETAGRMMAVPEIFDLEIIQTIRRLNRAGAINRPRANAAIQIFLAAPVDRYSHVLLRDWVWALRENLTAYDAAYFALAEMLDAELWTRDKKFAAIRGHRAQVKVL